MLHFVILCRLGFISRWGALAGRYAALCPPGWPWTHHRMPFHSPTHGKNCLEQILLQITFNSGHCFPISLFFFCLFACLLWVRIVCVRSVFISHNSGTNAFPNKMKWNRYAGCVFVWVWVFSKKNIIRRRSRSGRLRRTHLYTTKKVVDFFSPFFAPPVYSSVHFTFRNKFNLNLPISQ